MLEDYQDFRVICINKNILLLKIKLNNLINKLHILSLNPASY